MKNFTGLLVGTLVGVSLAALVSYGVRYAKPTQVAEKPVQIYAGDPIPVDSTTLPPSLYSCSDKNETLYLLVSPSSYEFAIFDESGAWVVNGQFFETKTEQGVTFLQGILGDNLIGLVQKGQVWHLAVVTPKQSTDMTCK